MPLLPRSARPAEQLAAASRVRGLLPSAAGWVLPPGVDDVPLEPQPQSQPQPQPVGSGAAAVGAPASHASPGLLARLRQGRLDPGRPAVWGLAVVALLGCLVSAVLVLRGRPQEVAPPVVERPGATIAGATLPDAAPQAAAPGASAPPADEVVVAVAGRVRRPGLVRLAAGSRVDDAVRAAGGPLPGASPGPLNLARRLVDGEQVLVGVEAPAGPAATAAAGGPAASGTVDLNTAGASELDALPGIGPVLAQRIVDHRTKNGPFRSVDQLREVSGIGEAKYQSLKDAVRV